MIFFISRVWDEHLIESKYISRKGLTRILIYVLDKWKVSVKEVFLRVLFSFTSGYNVSFIVPFFCNLELFAAESTNVDAFSCNLWYTLFFFQVSLFNILHVAPESNKKSISRFGGEIVFVLSGVCCVYIVRGVPKY